MSTIPTRHDDVEAQADEPKQKRAPYAQMPHYVLSHPDLSPGDRELYAHLDTFWRDKDECWPKQETLAGKMGVSVCTVHRRAKKLAGAKLIEIKQQGLNRPNRYERLPPPRPDLRVVPDPHDEPDLAEMQDQDLAEVQDKADAVEADKSKIKITARTAPPEPVPVPVPVPSSSPSDQALKDEDRLRVIRRMEEELLPSCKPSTKRKASRGMRAPAPRSRA
jgi:hypothetical protein